MANRIGNPQKILTSALPKKPKPKGVAFTLPPTQPKPTNPYGLSPEVSPYLSPQLDILKQQEDAQRNALAEYSKAIISALQNQVPGIRSDYDTAIGQSQQLAQAGADTLRQANGNDAIQGILQAAGAPSSQQAQIAGNLNNVFSGGASALFGSEGVSPGQQLISDKAANLAFANELPSVQGLAGTQALKNLLANSGIERQKILAQVPDIMAGVAKQRADILQAKNDAEYKTQYLDYLSGQLGVKKTAANTKIIGSATGGYYKVNTKTGAKTLVVPGTGSPAQAGRVVGSDKTGRFWYEPSTGTKTPLTPPVKAPPKTNPGEKPPTGNQLSNLVDQFYNGTPGPDKRVQDTDRNGQPAYDANGNPVYKTVPGQAIGRLTYQQAYKRLIAVHATKQQALDLLNTKWRRGERGRPYLGLFERKALSKARAKPVALYYKGHAYLNSAQVKALTAANLLPAGEIVNGRYFIAPSY